MDLKQLEYFVCTAEQQSFTRAGLVLNIAQPALSRQVRALEVEFGQVLMHRHGRGITLTDSGKLLLKYGRIVLNQVAHLHDEMGKARGALVGEVKLGMPPSLMRVMATMIFQKFKLQFPEASLSIREGLSVSMKDNLISGLLDVAILYNAEPSPDVNTFPLIDEEVFLVSSVKSVASDSIPKKIDIPILAKLPLILPSRFNALRKLVENETAQLGLHANIAYEIDGVGSILDLVTEGFGYAVLTQMAVSALGNPSLTIHPFQKPGLFVKLSLSVSSHRQITATQQALIELLQTTINNPLSHKSLK